jgi:MFS family permease
VSTSAAVGPFIGGVVVGVLGWRSMFFLAVPIGLAAAAFVGLAMRPQSKPAVPTDGDAAGHGASHPARPVDVPGLALLALTITAFLVALRGDTGALAVIATLAVVPLAVIFILVELREEHPAVDPRLFVNRPFAAALAGVFGATVILHGSFILVPLTVEELLGASPATSGVALLGIAGVAAIIAPFGGRVSDRRGRRLVVVAGAAISAAALAVLALPAATASIASIAALLGVVGFGNGLTSPRQAAALESVAPSRVGMAAGTYYTGRYLGGVVGASLAGAVLGTRVSAEGVGLGFAILAAVGLAVVVASLGLRGAVRGPQINP